MEIDYLEDIGVDGRIFGTALIWLRIETGGGCL
jgi:hypothetical protein